MKKKRFSVEQIVGVLKQAEVGVPESTMKAIAGLMSAKMLERYSHTRQQAKRGAVNKLPRRRPA